MGVVQCISKKDGSHFACINDSFENDVMLLRLVSSFPFKYFSALERLFRRISPAKPIAMCVSQRVFGMNHNALHVSTNADAYFHS